MAAVAVDEAHTSHIPSLHDWAAAQLADSPYISVRRLIISVTDKVITLSGIVPTYYHRQTALTRIMKIGGFITIVDNIQVS